MAALVRSTNVATKVICGSQQHINFTVVPTASKVIPISDVVTEFKNEDSMQAAASRSTRHEGLLSTNFAIKGINVSSRRLAHTDITFPDMSSYRREVTLDAEKAARETEDQRRSLYPAVYYGAGGMMSLWVGKEVIQTSVIYKSMAADQRALASIEINMNEIPEGVTKTFEWRGKPVFVKHRTKAEIEREKAVNLSELRHAEHDDQRVKKPEWSVVIGVCTHLGCVPIANAGDFGGYFCPCHGSHYDASGRVRKGPAPLNLQVPEYTFKDNVIVVGSS
ncbi:ubiquinol-cytochrome c reductase, iron-sulfur subunit [Dictyocaulus viviparus]|uniref:Cytochrome b-c1 complex subunit Rieske, mitochondrial n=1 Tax=Dictyocaulus viviparus TaxID=29172 RepID=A0A0D8XZE2_DICVI|nr:ubiquinol-cytochrome c reductase, iron-sulfur subunit [Dictyocaulus viviparus]